jgi:hypothetical protein
MSKEKERRLKNYLCAREREEGRGMEGSRDRTESWA